MCYVGHSETLPHFTAHPQSIGVIESTVTLDCKISNSTYTDITVQWIVNGTQNISTPSDNYELAENGYSLKISNYDDALNGEYFCLISNGDWTLRSATAVVRKEFLRSLYGDEFFKEITVQENSHVVVVPEYDSYYLDPSDIEFEWLASTTKNSLDADDYFLAGNEAENNFFVSSNGTLVIPVAKTAETYQCEIELHTATIYYRVRVAVEDEGAVSGHYIAIPPENVTANEEDIVSFDCIPVGL